MGATESQLKQREEDDEEFVTHLADTDKSNNDGVNHYAATSSSESPRQQHPQQFIHSHHNSSQPQPQQSLPQLQPNERQLEDKLAQAEDELNDMRQRTHSMRERRKGTIKVRRTEPGAATATSNTIQAAVAASPAPGAATTSLPSESSHSNSQSLSSSASHDTLPRPPSPPPAKTTHSEATLAYLIQSLQSNSHHQHIDVIKRQIELLKEKMNEYRREKEKEAKEDERMRVEGQREEWLQAMDDIARNHSSNVSSSESTTSSDESESNAKKARHESTVKATTSTSTAAAIAAAVPAFSADPVFHQQSSPDFTRSQFQQIRETIARDEVYSYPNDDEDDEMQYPTLMQDEQDEQQQEPTNYQAIYARMSEIIQQDSDRDADMPDESAYNAPAPISSVTSTPPTAFTTTPTTVPPPSVPIVLSSMMDVEDHPAPPSSQPLLITRSQLSRNILDLCLVDIGSLEDRYLSGKITFDQLRFSLTVLHNVLIPQHENELVEHFLRMRIKKHSTSSDGESNNNATTIIRPSDSILHRTLLSLPLYNESFTPDLAVDDDPDGCARLRNQVFVDPSIQTHTTTQGHLKRKKTLKRLDSSEPVASPSSIAVSASSSPAPNTSSLSSVKSISLPPLATINGAPFRLCRMHYVNHAFERLFGFSQADIKGTSFYDLTLRKDHAQASHRLRHKWWSEKTIDSMMYEVRVTKDGTFIYCLVHWRISFLKESLRQVVISFLPLPDDPEHPMPPYVEGVDLDIDTLLYGYKPPIATATKGVPENESILESAELRACH